MGRTETELVSQDNRMTDAPHLRLSLLAVLSFVLGLLALYPRFLIVVGLPALLLGLFSLRHINHSDGRLRGGWFAVAGMVLGGIGTAVSLFGVLAMVALHLQEPAQRLQCENNLREIGLALNLAHNDQKVYPPATLANPELPPEKRLSWLAVILPFLHQPGVAARPLPERFQKPRTVFEALDKTKAWGAVENRSAVNTVLPEFLSPDHPETVPPETPGRTHYVGIGGLGPDAAALPADDPRAGFFGYDRRLTRNQLQEAHGEGKTGRGEDALARGESRTLVVIETAAEIGPWAAGGFPTVRGLDPAERPYTGPGRPFGGLHRGGFHVLFADGAVWFLRDSIDPEKLEVLVPINPVAEK
jgi:prepilin-type processing-associated H-X9-DG protein